LELIKIITLSKAEGERGNALVTCVGFQSIATLFMLLLPLQVNMPLCFATVVGAA
jgi:hypothetical protein